MKKATLTEDKAEQTSTGGVLVGKREGQTIIHNKGTLSGYLVGKTHAEGGIQAINKSTGQPLEMQGGEVVITAPAVSDNTKREFEGKMMTNREILSAINEKGGGVAFAKDGMEIPKSIKHTGASYKYGGKTMTDHEIMMKINGGHLAEGYSLREIASIHQVPLSTLKNQVRLGMKAESEHTQSKREQMKIVKDHLFENPKYYTLLKKAGLKDGGEIESLYKDENDYVKYLVERNLTDGVEEYKLQEYLKSKGLSSVGLLPDNIKKDPEYIKIKKDYDLAFKKLQNLPIYKYPKNRDRVQDQKDLRKAREISEKIIQIKLKKESFAKGGQTESLVRDAKSGNTPARDLNNYNDVLDLEADGMVGAETSLYVNGGKTDDFSDLYAPEFIEMPINVSLEDLIKRYDKEAGLSGMIVKFKLGDRNIIAQRKFTYIGGGGKMFQIKTKYIHIDWVDDFNKKYPKYYKSWKETNKGIIETTYPKFDDGGSVGAETGLYADGGLIAPNGNKTNLTPEQYKLVRTPEFKAWFGDWENDPENASKVVDENGEPLVVYHGTYVENPFYIFDFDKADLGFHFGTYEQAKNRSETKLFFKGRKSIVNSFFLNIKTIFESTDIGEWEYPQRYIDMFVSDGLISESDAKKNGFYRLVQREENKQIREYLLNKYGKFGGFVYNNKYEGKGNSFIVLNPNQIKLADGTNTKFDNMNPDIRYADGGMFNTEPFLNYYFDEIAEFLKYQNNITLNKDFTFKYKGELFRVEPIVLSEKNIKEAYFSIIDSDNEEVGDIVFNPNNNKKFEANSDFFDWNNIKFYDGGNVKPYDANMEGDSADMIFAEGGAVSSVVNNWDEVPSIWKNTSKVKKVAWTNSPYDKGLYSIVAPFLGNDDLRPIMSGINFDENGITVTDAHKMICLPYPSKEFEGIYEADLSKRVNPEQITISGKYPNYAPIIPESKNTVKYEVDVYKLLQYTNVAIKYANKTTYAVNYKIYDEIIGFNANYLNQVLTTLLKLGHDKVYGHFVGYTKAFIFSPQKDYELGNDDILLIMPLVTDKKFYGAEDILYGSNRKLSVYYDFNDNEIHNADGSIAEFKMTYENNSVISKEDVTLLEKLANGKNKLPILDYVLIENGIARASDLDSEYYLSGVPLPDGIYKPNKGALEITMEAMDDYPLSPIFVTDEDTIQFVISSGVLEYYVDKFQNVVGKDDLRPVMQGICLHHTSDNKLFLAGTDANILLKVNITEYVDMPVYNKDMKFIIEPKRLYDFLNSTENTALTIKSNLVATSIQSDNWSFYARNIDGNYPNYEAVIPRETSKFVSVGIDPIKKAFNTEMVKNYVKEAYSKDKVFIFNKENEIFIATGTNGENIEILCETNVDFRLDDYYNDNKNVLLIMPFGYNKQNNFAFRKDLLERVFKIVNDNKLDLHYNELNRAYLIPIDSFDFKSTTKEFKVREQKPSVAEVKLVSTINEVSEIKEAIETLEMLSETATRKDKKEIKEAIEVLQMLLDTYEY